MALQLTQFYIVRVSSSAPVYCDSPSYLVVHKANLEHNLYSVND